MNHWLWRRGPVAPGPAVVFDIDGVLSDARGRQHYLDRSDWRGFFDASIDDPVIDEIARLTELIDPTVIVVLLTGRPLRIQNETVSWLEKNSIRWDLIVMRNVGNYAAVTSFKKSTVTDLRAFGLDLVLAVEDDPDNRDMFRDAGIPCLYIHSGYYER